VCIKQCPSGWDSSLLANTQNKLTRLLIEKSACVSDVLLKNTWNCCCWHENVQLRIICRRVSVNQWFWWPCSRNYIKLWNFSRDSLLKDDFRQLSPDRDFSPPRPSKCDFRPMSPAPQHESIVHCWWPLRRCREHHWRRYVSAFDFFEWWIFSPCSSNNWKKKIGKMWKFSSFEWTSFVYEQYLQHF